MPKFWHLTNYRAGHLAEKFALIWLWLHGYHLVARNFVVGRGTGAGEVDLIVRRGHTLVFVEVKKRATLDRAKYAVQNQRRIERTTQVFLSRYPKYRNDFIRYDVILFAGGHLSHIRDAWRPVCVMLCCGLLMGCQMWGTLLSGVQSVGTVVADDRPLSDDINDATIYANVRQKLADLEIKSILDVQITVFQGAVLLTGALPNMDIILRVVETTWQASGVNRVYNYIRLGETLGFIDTLQESALSATLRTRLTFTKGIASSNYKIVMENGTVYVMGLRADEDEWLRARAVIKDTYGVDKIIYLMQDLDKKSD